MFHVSRYEKSHLLLTKELVVLSGQDSRFSDSKDISLPTKPPYAMCCQAEQLFGVVHPENNPVLSTVG